MSKKFRVEDKETIADCLDRMKKEGLCQYVVLRNQFIKTKDGSIEILKQDIIFVGALIQ